MKWNEKSFHRTMIRWEIDFIKSIHLVVAQRFAAVQWLSHWRRIIEHWSQFFFTWNETLGNSISDDRRIQQRINSIPIHFSHWRISSTNRKHLKRQIQSKTKERRIFFEKFLFFFSTVNSFLGEEQRENSPLSSSELTNKKVQMTLTPWKQFSLFYLSLLLADK